MNDHECELYDNVQLGSNASLFLKSDLGQYIIRRADAEKDNALNELLMTDPTNADKIREIQNKAMICQAAIGWLLTAISEGNTSGLLLETYRD